MNKDVSVLIADDHNCISKNLRTELVARGYPVVGEAGSSAEAVELFRLYKPSVAVLGLAMAGVGGIDAARIIKTETSSARIVGYAETADFYAVNLFLDAGGMGFVIKSRCNEEAVLAVASVAAGRSYLCSASSQILVSGDGEAKVLCRRLLLLTRRERQVWAMVCGGMTSRMMAESMQLSPRTVERFRLSLRTKLEVSSVEALVQVAVTTGFMIQGAV